MAVLGRFGYNKSSAPTHRLLRKVYRWLPRRKDIARVADKAFAITGCSQPEWGAQAARISSCASHVLGVLAAGAARRRRRAACGGVWELCVFWNLAEIAAPKCRRATF